jgi:hypothetical protein
MGSKDKDNVARRQRERYARQAERMRKIKTDAGCMDCGYNEHHAGLEFDHREPRLGGKTVSQLLGRGWDTVLAEIAKCDVVCAICHNIRTFERLQASLKIDN